MAERDPTGPRELTPRLAAVAALLFLFGALLRLYRVGEQVLLDDEWHALNAVHDQGYRWIFSHLGHADHSIPLTLLYEFFSRTIGLSEWTLRLPSVAAGIATLLLVPWLLRHWLKPGERVMLMALLAVSPMLVNYSRIARPYAMLALLGAAAIPLAWRWWQRQRPSPNAWAWYACTVFGAWLNPVTLATTTGPYLWFLPAALRAARRESRYGPLVRVCGMSIMMVSGLLLLLFVPLSVDWASLAVKSGVHEVTPGTARVALGLFAGTGFTLLALVMLALAVAGWAELHRRDAAFARYLLLTATAATIAVSLTGAAWIGEGIVLARYLVGLLPLFLALTALGLFRFIEWAMSGHGRVRTVQAMAGIALASLLVMSGPLLQQDFGRSQFLHHMYWQFDYDEERNPIRAALADVRTPDFYRDIAAAHPNGNAVIVEAPWWLESNWNALPLYQRVHKQQVRIGMIGGVCAGDLYGEIDPDTPGIALRNFLHLSALLEGRQQADYVVFRDQGPAGARSIAMDTGACLDAMQRAWGPPWRRDGNAWVFRPARGS
ncbi:MAG: hypothetical protein HKN58_03405 [Xanthomonadales bacterium]|nr:hypothetical protein [Xanthomonadales bacterium]